MSRGAREFVLALAAMLLYCAVCAVIAGLIILLAVWATA